MRKRLERCRQAAVLAAQESARTKEPHVRQSYAFLAESWKGLADDLERRLNSDSVVNNS
jgi:hypothetical protein